MNWSKTGLYAYVKNILRQLQVPFVDPCDPTYEGDCGPCGGAGTDELAKVSANDTTAGFLDGKLVAGTNITLIQNNDGANETLTINAVGGVAGEVNTGSSLGGTEAVFAGKVGVDLQFKGLTAGTGVSLTSDANSITINSDGEPNTGSNLGAGEGVFAAKVGDDLQFKSLVAGANITLTPTANTITIATGGAVGEANTASNLGAGQGLFVSKVGVDLQFKSIVAGANITLTPAADTLTIASTGGGGSSFAWFDAGNGVHVYASGTATTTAKAAGVLTIDGNNDEIRSFRFVGGASDLNSGELLVHVENNGAQDGVGYTTGDADTLWPYIGIQNRTTVLPTDPYQQRPDDAGDSINIFNERFALAARTTVKITGLSGDFGLYGQF